MGRKRISSDAYYQGVDFESIGIVADITALAPPYYFLFFRHRHNTKSFSRRLRRDLAFQFCQMKNSSKRHYRVVSRPQYSACAARDGPIKLLAPKADVGISMSPSPGSASACRVSQHCPRQPSRRQRDAFFSVTEVKYVEHLRHCACRCRTTGISQTVVFVTVCALLAPLPADGL